MPNWKKVLVSGSDGSLNSLYVGTSVTASIFSGSHIGPLTGTASRAVTASYAINGNINGTGTAAAGTTTTILTVATGSYTAGFFDYTVSSGSNARAGLVMSVWNGSSIQYTDNSTLDIGSTNDITMSVALSGANALFRATTTTYAWTVKALYRLI